MYVPYLYCILLHTTDDPVWKQFSSLHKNQAFLHIVLVVTVLGIPCSLALQLQLHVPCIKSHALQQRTSTDIAFTQTTTILYESKCLDRSSGDASLSKRVLDTSTINASDDILSSCLLWVGVTRNLHNKRLTALSRNSDCRRY